MTHPGQQLELFSDFRTAYKPQRPLCSNSKNGPYYRRSKSKALASYQFVEANPACLKSLVVLDCDHPDHYIYEEHGIQPPSYSIQNIFTEHFHAVYSLASPVILTDAARRPPVNLLARVETGLTRAFKSDDAYGGRITRNPLKEGAEQRTTWGINGDTTSEEMRQYTLRELAASLDQAKLLPGYYEKSSIRDSSVGRNVTLFDMTRQWGYRAVKRYWKEPYSLWHEIVEAYATNKNLSIIADEWGTPLPTVEVKHLAKSISKWIWTRFTPEHFSKIQAARNQKRKANTVTHLEEALQTLGVEKWKG